MQLRQRTELQVCRAQWVSRPTWRAPRQTVSYASVCWIPCFVPTARSHSIRTIYGDWVKHRAERTARPAEHKRVLISATMSNISSSSSQTQVALFIHAHTHTPNPAPACTPILLPPAEHPLIIFLTTTGPTPPPASTTKAIFSLATAMTHFLPQHKATSLACSQMVWFAHSRLNNSASDWLGKRLIPDHMARLSVNHCETEGDWWVLCSMWRAACTSVSTSVAYISMSVCVSWSCAPCWVYSIMHHTLHESAVDVMHM